MIAGHPIPRYETSDTATNLILMRWRVNHGICIRAASRSNVDVMIRAHGVDHVGKTMSNEIKSETAETELKDRRDFLKGAGEAAIAAPAVALILSASTKPASADAISLYNR